MDITWGLISFFLGLWALIFVVGGLGLGWYSYFQIRKLKAEMKDLRRATGSGSGSGAFPWSEAPKAPQTPEPSGVREPDPVEVPLPPETAFPETPAAVPRSVAPPRTPGWEGKFLENWTGLVGLAIITLGLGFLAAYAATVLAPFGRFLLIVAAAALLMTVGVVLPRKKPRWTRWGYWLQSLAAAVFLLACLGSGGIPGVAWVTHPLAALGLLVVGIAVNFVLGSLRRRQPYLTLHVVLSLVALAVPGPDPLILLFLTATAFTGVALAWFQKWTYNRAVTALVFQGILMISRWRTPDIDPTLQIWYVLASAGLAILVHFASYRRLDRGVSWSRPRFLTHLANAVGAGLACALWAPRYPLATVVVLGILVLGLAVLSLRARQTGTSWLYRTDRVLALGVAALVLMLNPLGALPLALASGFSLLVLVFAWTAFREGDPLLTRIGDGLVFATLALLPLAAWWFQTDVSGFSWVWGAGSCFVVGLAAGAFFALRAGSLPGWWSQGALGALPAVFVFPLAALWGDSTPFPGLIPGWVLVLPWLGLGWLRRRLDSRGLSWGWSAAGWLVSAVAWGNWVFRHGYAGPDPIAVLMWGGPVVLLSCLPLFFGSPRPGALFTATFLGAVTTLAAWLTTSVAGLAPALPPAVILGLMLVVLAGLRPLGTLDSRLPRYTLWWLSGILVLARIAALFLAPDASMLWVDAAAVGVLALFAVLPSTAPGAFWEMALAGGLWLFWNDLPREAFPLFVALLALGTLAAGRYSPRGRRLDWYAPLLFLAANALAVLSDVVWVKGATLATLAAFLVLESLAPEVPFEEGSWTERWRPYRRYALVLIQGVAWAVALPTFLDPRILTFGWSFESALLFVLALIWKDGLFKNASFLALAACLIRLLIVDLANTDVLTKAVTFLSVGGLMVGMNVLYLWSRNRQRKPQ